jgi:hypothetical protein
VNIIWYNNIKFWSWNISWCGQVYLPHGLFFNHVFATSSETSAANANFFYGGNTTPISIGAVINFG